MFRAKATERRQIRRRCLEKETRNARDPFFPFRYDPDRHLFAIQDGRCAQPLWLPAERFVRGDKKKGEQRRNNKRGPSLGGDQSRRGSIISRFDLIYYIMRRSTCTTRARKYAAIVPLVLKASFTKRFLINQELLKDS